MSKYLEALKSSMVEMDTVQPAAKLMFYGESGVGKTVAAMETAQAILPVGKKILYIDAVEGWVSLLNHPGLTDNTQRMEYKGISQLEYLADALPVDEFFQQFGVIVVDEFSTIAKFDLDTVLKARAKSDPSKDADVPTQPDYLAATERVRRAFMKMAKVNVHQIYLSHVREDKDEKSKTMTRPAFMPKLSQTIREGLHVVAYMTATEKTVDDKPVYVRALQTHPSKSIVAKSRVGGLGIYSTVSNFNKVLVEWLKGNIETQEVQDVVEDKSDSVARSDDDPAIVVD